MEKRQLGKTDMQVTALGFGGAEIGSSGQSAQEVSVVLNGALDAGLNIIDTAECYGTGEESVGESVSHRRSEFYLFTKCGHAAGIDLPDWDLKLLEQSIDRSLKRLKTDHVDLLQLHSCTRELLEQGDVIQVLKKAQEAGKTRYLGYSGDNEDALYAIECGQFDTLQTSISLADQWAIPNSLAAAKAKGMGVIVKRPIGNAAWKYSEKPDNGYIVPYWERYRKLQYPFLSGDNLEESAAIVLRFTLGLPGVTTAIVGTTKPGRWAQNARAVEQGPLPEELQQEIFTRWQQRSEADWVGQR